MTQKMPYENAIKYGFILIIVIIGLIVVSKIAKAITGDPDKRQSAKEAKKSNLTYDDIVYTNFAKTLYQAMNGWGTDQDTVVNTIKKLKNKDDYYYLQSIYEDKDGTLDERLVYELEDNKKERKIVFDYLNSIGVII